MCYNFINHNIIILFAWFGHLRRIVHRFCICVCAWVRKRITRINCFYYCPTCTPELYKSEYLLCIKDLLYTGLLLYASGAFTIIDWDHLSLILIFMLDTSSLVTIIIINY